MEKGKSKNPVFPIIGLVLLCVLIAGGLYLRYSFYTSTPETKELLMQTERFLDGMSDATFFYNPSPAGTVEAYAAVFNFTGVKESLAMHFIILLEAVASILLFVLSERMLGSFYAVLCVIVMQVPVFFGIPVNVYEELPVICLLLFEIMLSLTRKIEEFSDEGPLYFRYIFVGATAGLSLFLMPGNLIIMALSVLLTIYFLAQKRKLKIIPELLINFFSLIIIFTLLILIRVMNTALPPIEIVKGYREHLTDSWGAQYLFVIILLMLLFIIEIIISFLPGKKLEDEAKKKRPVSTGDLPGDFVLHRAGKEGSAIVSGKDDKEEKKVEEVKEVKPEEKKQSEVLVQSVTPVQPVQSEVNAAPEVQSVQPEVQSVQPEQSTVTVIKTEIPMPEVPDEPPSYFKPVPGETEEEKEARIAAYREYAENLNPNDLEFDFDIPYDDDFEIEVKF